MRFYFTIFTILAISFSACAAPTPLNKGVTNGQGLMDFLTSLLGGDGNVNGQEGSGSGNERLVDLLEKIFPSGFPGVSLPGQNSHGEDRSGTVPVRPTPSCSTTASGDTNGPVRPTPTPTATPTRRPSNLQPPSQPSTTPAPPSQPQQTALPGDSVSTISFELAGPGGR